MTNDGHVIDYATYRGPAWREIEPGIFVSVSEARRPAAVAAVEPSALKAAQDPDRAV